MLGRGVTAGLMAMVGFLLPIPLLVSAHHAAGEPAVTQLQEALRPTSLVTATTGPTARPGPVAAPPAGDPFESLRGALPPPPVRLRIAALGVDAPVVPVGLEGDGQMEVPADVGTVGWYRFGPAPGEPGSAVVAGHVDRRGQGPGSFFRLSQLEPGDRIEVGHDDASVTVYEVVTTTLVAKATVPLRDVFARDGPPRLTLITCGGRYDPAARHYESNVIVVAAPVD